MSHEASALRLWRTVRHLRTRQLVGQLRARLPLLQHDPARFASRELPAYPGGRWLPDEGLVAPGAQSNRAPALLAGRFEFLNASIDLGWPPKWERDDLPKLWQYNLHYFEWLWALDHEHAVAAVRDWITRHELRPGRVGWEPYPLSLRLMSWMGVLLGRDRRRTESDPLLIAQLWRSIALQAEWLRRHLESHLMGNHLLENAAALVLAGSCFEGRLARKWYRTGRRELEQQLREQILSDGMHFERSPMYHLRVTYLLVLLLGAGLSDLQRLLREPLARMLAAMHRLRHPDGRIPLLNDSAFGIYNEPGQLLRAGAGLLPGPAVPPPPPPGAWALPEAGYYGFNGARRSYIICDAGPIGPDYLPGHAHGDIFSFEMSCNGHRVIVDSGVHDYEESAMRRYCRSTRAHNTVEIDDQDQCEFWGAFRVARRGRPRDVLWRPTSEGFSLSGLHDGYARLPGSPRHRRRLVWREPGVVEIHDQVTASRAVKAVSRLHLHPHCVVRQVAEQRIELEYPGGRLKIGCSGAERFELEDAFYCPEFGVQQRNVALALVAHGSKIETTIRIVPA